MRSRRIGLVLGIALLIEVVAAVTIVQAQPGGFGALFNVGFGPERRQEIPARTFTFNDQTADVSIQNGSGQIEITADPTVNGVQVAGAKIIHGNNERDFDRMNLNVTQSGNGLRVESKFDTDVTFGFSPSILIQVRVSPDRLAHLSAHTGSGDIMASGVQNQALPMELSTGSGDMQLSNLTLQKLSLETGSGDLRLNGYTGGLQAQTGSGDLRLDGQNNLSAVNLKTGSGEIQGEASFKLSANGEISTGSGDVKLQVPEGSQLPGFSLNTSSGDLHFNLKGANAASVGKHQMESPGSPTVSIHTGSGDVELNN